ncbi:hypothetical protein [Palpita vitrealis nucleopolyhedrovirus]|uniref:Uncharacterized protein n=1 Tax=Palpita vitrealis nucleopolyhedrovirus TaxID=2951960 RepID=A0AAE9LNM4_9ABAC|nr:hypothetical protein [Palpita vitrealis nucleopolyhedrovirus]
MYQKLISVAVDTIFNIIYFFHDEACGYNAKQGYNEICANLLMFNNNDSNLFIKMMSFISSSIIEKQMTLTMTSFIFDHVLRVGSYL